MAVKNFYSEEEENFLCNLRSALKLCGSDPPEIRYEREPTIIDKLSKLAKEASSSGSKDKHKGNQDNANISLESVIPLLLEREKHNYLIIDSFDISVKKEEGIEPLWSFLYDEGDRETYSEWFDYFDNRLWPSDVGEMLLEFSKNSVKICYDNYVIVELKNIKYKDDNEVFNSVLDRLNEGGENSERQIISKFLLVKIEENEKCKAPDDNLFHGQFLCLDPQLPDVQIESIFDRKTKTNKFSTNNKSTQGNEPEVTNCKENVENNIKDIYSLCRMGVFLTARTYPETKENKISESSTVETFLFKYFCESENQSIAFNKVLSVAKTLRGKFCISQDEDPTCPFNTESIEFNEQSDVDKIIHKVYHKCLDECSSQIAVFHKFGTRGFQNIFNIAFKEGTKISSSSFTAYGSSWEKKFTKQRKLNPEASLIRVSYIDVPEESPVPGKIAKSKCLPFEDVDGWFEAKKKNKFDLKLGIEHLLDKRRRHILLGDSFKDIIQEINRLKRAFEEDSASLQSNKKTRTEETETVVNLAEENDEMESEISTPQPNIYVTSTREREPEQTDSMEVEESPSNANPCEEEIPGVSGIAECDLNSWPGPSNSLKDYKKDGSRLENEYHDPFDEILDQCLKNKEKYSSPNKD